MAVDIELTFKYAGKQNAFQGTNSHIMAAFRCFIQGFIHLSYTSNTQPIVTNVQLLVPGKRVFFFFYILRVGNGHFIQNKNSECSFSCIYCAKCVCDEF